MGWLEELHATLDKRAMPEQVARIIRAGRPALTARVNLEVNRVAAARSPWWVSSMPEDFERVPDCREQIAAVTRIFGLPAAGAAGAGGIDPGNAREVRAFIAAMGLLAGGWRPGDDWKRDRLGREQRAAVQAEAGAPIPALASKRQYNRHVRVLRHLEEKRARMEHAQAFRRLVLVGRSGFACDIPLERFAADPATACFIAYFTARKNKRRMFTLAGKENPVDHLAQSLLDFLGSPLMTGRTDWEMLAWVYPQPDVLARLADEQRGALMGRWWSVMRDTAAMLQQAWPDGVNRLSMIVRRGMDSSTWNTMAQAYNAARAAWISCLAASGAWSLLEPFCPGKVMRLMAADLAWWHQASGGDVDPDTKVWAFLPMPWDVISGKATCTRADVEAACRAQGIDPAARGWTAPRAEAAVAGFRPTPELVHGVEIGDPAWAALLRRAGVFSGKGIRPAMAAEAGAVPAGVVTGQLPVRDGAGNYLGTVTSGTFEGTA